VNIAAQDGGGSPAEKLLHAFADPMLLRTALTHRSASRGARGSNERLEFLGDRVLGLVIAEWLLERFPMEREGDIGKRLGSLVAAETLAEVAERINLAAMMIVPDSEARSGLSQRQSLLADALEAVIAALYLDGGLDAARRFVRAHWAALLDRQLAPPVSAKNRLQEWLMGRGQGLPTYRQVSASGPPHAPRFVVAVDAAADSAEGSGTTKRAAEEEAAAALLARLGIGAS
jgi:ribonuclease-3